MSENTERPKFRIQEGWKLSDRASVQKDTAPGISEILKGITDAAFDSKGDRPNYGRIRINPGPSWSYPGKHRYFNLNIDSSRVSEMVRLISEKVWNHLQEARDERVEELFDAAKESVNETLSQIEKYLYSYATDGPPEESKRNIIFKRRAVTRALNILSRNAHEILNQQRRKPKIVSEDVKGYVMINPNSPAWHERENDLIIEIREIYNSHINQLLEMNRREPIAKDHIAFFIALVFEATGIWKDRNAFETMKKRFQKL